MPGRDTTFSATLPRHSTTSLAFSDSPEPARRSRGGRRARRAPVLAARIAQPTLVSRPFHREGWIYEEKVDGWRMVAHKDGAQPCGSDR
jgi:ATP-dependent DNA ligase